MLPTSQSRAQLSRIDQSNGITDSPGSNMPEAKPEFRLWQIIWRRKWRVIVALTFVMALTACYAVLTGPWYESTAQVLVLKKRLETAPISGPSLTQPPEDYLATHILLITSPRIARQAVTSRRLEDLEVFQKKDPLGIFVDSASTYLFGNRKTSSPEDALASRIVATLKASSDTTKPGTPPSHEVLTVTFQGNVSDDCSKVLDAVIASYQDFLRETYQDVNAETLELITRARDVLQKDITTKEAAYAEFRRNTPVLWKGKDGITLQQDRLFSIDTKILALHIRSAEIKDSLEEIAKAKRDGRSLGEILLLIPGLPANQDMMTPSRVPNSDPTFAARTTLTLQEELFKLKLDEKKLREAYGPEYPEVLAIRRRIQDVSDLLRPSSPVQGSGSNPSVWDADLVNLKIQLLEQELAENKRVDRVLREQFERDQTDAKAAIVHEIEYEAHRAGIERSKVLYESIVTRLREIDSVRDYGGYNTQIIAAPKSDLNKKKYALVFLGALLSGLLVGFSWACLAEFKDKSFRTSREIRDQLGLPVLGDIPSFRPLAGEAYLAVGQALYHATKSGECRVIQITSPIHREGKTALAANLAVSMAQSGLRVVLIDADLRRPRMADLFGVSKQIGLSSVLAGEADLAAAVQPSVVPGLSIIGSGPELPNPAEAVASPHLGTLLDSLRQQCDYVLIDTPPLLTVTDSRLVSHCVDGVVLTLRNSKQVRPLAQCAREILDDAGTRILGVVVKGVARPSGIGNDPYAKLSAQRWAQNSIASPTS